MANNLDTCLYSLLGITDEDRAYTLSKTSIKARFRKAHQAIKQLKVTDDLKDQYIGLLILGTDILSDTKTELKYAKEGTNGLPEAEHDCELAKELCDQLNAAKRSSQNNFEDPEPAPKRIRRATSSGSTTTNSSPLIIDEQPSPVASFREYADQNAEAIRDAREAVATDPFRPISPETIEPAPPAAEAENEPPKDPEPANEKEPEINSIFDDEFLANMAKQPYSELPPAKRNISTILDHQKRKDEVVFKVKWSGLDLESHEPYSSIRSQLEPLDNYVRQLNATKPRRLKALLANIPELLRALKN